MSQQYTTISLEALKLLCATINKTVDLPNTVISDISIATNTTYSSFKLDKEFTTLEDELKHYTDTAIAGLNKLTKEIINDKSLVVKDNVLYLYKAADDPSNDYMQMMLINGVAVELGSTQVDMTDYYNKTDSDNRFAAKLDLDTLTAVVNDKIDKTSILTVIDNSATDDQVYSAKAINSELYNINANLGDKADVSELTGLKRRYNSIEELNAIKKKSLILVNGEDNTQKVLDALDAGEVLIDYFSNNESTSRFGISSSLGTYFIITFEKNDNGYAKITAKSTSSDTILIRYHNANELSAWQKVCTTSVADVPITYINTFEDETYVKPSNTNVCSYQVINGHCIIRIETYCLASTTQNFVQIFSGLPKPTNELFSNAIDRNMKINSGARGVFNMLTNGTLRIVCDYGDSSIVGLRYLYATFSYPVAEN